MKSLKVQKKFSVLFLAIFSIIAFAIMLTFVPIDFTTASYDFFSDFASFENSLYEMYEKYDQNAVSTLSLESDDDIDDDYGHNRLLLTADKTVDDCGAVMKATYKDYYIFQYEDSESARNAFNYYDSLPEVKSLSYDVDVCVQGEVADEVEVNTTYTYNTWGAEYVGYSAYTNTMLDTYSVDKLNNVVVAVLDSGINTSHELFEGRILHEYAKDFTNNADESTTIYQYEDYNGHGTHVSGTIAEATLSNVKILPLKVLKKDGRGSASSIVDAILYLCGIKSTLKADGYDLKMMNMSIGIDTSSTIQNVSSKATTITQSVISAYNNGIISIVAAGNEHQNTSNCIPANIEQAIVVSAVKKTFVFPYGNQLVFDGNASNQGYSNYGETVDFAAPGTAIKSAYIGGTNVYEYLTGTSMATPHVTACVALIYSNPLLCDLDFDGLNKLLRENADRTNLVSTGTYALGDAEKNIYYGYGLINIANIGTLVDGEVTFSEENIYHTSSFNLALSYDFSLQSGQTLEIYYTTDEDATNVNKNNGTKYSGTAIALNKTTKITATAFVYSAEGNLVRRSNDVSKTYYFNNTDLKSMYEITNGVLKAYNGKELTTLNVEATLNITSISKGAFNNSPVQNLNLPNSVSNFLESAFDGNAKLVSVKCDSEEIKIASKAFYNCSNLVSLNFGDRITSIGDLAFAYSNLNTLELPNVTSIGLNAFSSSSLQKLIVGKNITNFETQAELDSNLVIYGYSSTPTEEIAKQSKLDFFDLTLTANALKTHKIIKQSDTLNLSLDFVGYDVTPTVNFSGLSSKISQYINDISQFEKEIVMTISGLSKGNYTLSVQFKDRFGTVLTTNTLKLEIVDDNADTFTINFNNGEFMVFVDDEVIDDGTLLYKGYSYNLNFVPVNGYNITYVSINAQSYPTNEAFVLSNVQEDLNISVQTVAQSNLTIRFVTEGKGKIIVDGSVVENDVVYPSRNSSLSFEIDSNIGYYVVEVLVDGQVLREDDDGLYHLNDITTNQEVSITFEQAEWNITLSYVNASGACTVTPSDSSLKNIAHGSSREFTIIVKDGFVLDYVTVNGEKIEVVDNTFRIDNIDSDKDVVISFKPSSNSIFASENKVVFYYFMIFLGLFILFVVARVALHFIKKEKNR
ncbi:MAG: S8 family serine peptidase [Candidatus Caccovivens sp.]